MPNTFFRKKYSILCGFTMSLLHPSMSIALEKIESKEISLRKASLFIISLSLPCQTLKIKYILLINQVESSH